MRSLRFVFFACSVCIPALASANGGVSRWHSSSTEGAMLSAQAGALGKRVLVPERDVECASELLTLTLQESGVDVDVEYSFVNRGKTKTVEYAFPFSVGHGVRLASDYGGKETNQVSLGEPLGYSIEVDGTQADAKVSPGGAVPADIPTPNINQGGDDAYGKREVTSTSYDWSYRVTPIEFPKDKTVTVKVTYSAPWLIYRESSELGSVKSPGTFSYLLSTGGGWRKGRIGKFRMKVVGAGLPLARASITGPDLKQSNGEVFFEATNFKPTRENDIVIKVTDWKGENMTSMDANAKALLAAKPKAPWQSPPVASGQPLELGFTVDLFNDGRSTRFRIGMAIDNDPANARPKKASVELRFHRKPPEVFHASFRDLPTSDIEASGGMRYIYVDTFDDVTISEIHLTFTDVFPGTNANNRMQVRQFLLERDVSDYEAHIGVPR